MDLKGGIAYLNMKGNDIVTINNSDNAIYVNNLYKDALKIIKSKKICVIYNASTVLSNVPIVVTGYNLVGDTSYMVFTAVTSSGSAVSRRLCIKSDSKYFIQTI